MYLEQVAANDYRKLTERDNRPVTIIEPDGTEHEQAAQQVRIDLITDPTTGQSFAEPRSIVTLDESSLPDNVAINELKIRFTDGSGNTVEGYVDSYMSDHTLGFITLTLERVENVG